MLLSAFNRKKKQEDCACHTNAVKHEADLIELASLKAQNCNQCVEAKEITNSEHWFKTSRHRIADWGETDLSRQKDEWAMEGAEGVVELERDHRIWKSAGVCYKNCWCVNMDLMEVSHAFANCMSIIHRQGQTAGASVSCIAKQLRSSINFMAQNTVSTILIWFKISVALVLC